MWNNWIREVVHKIKVVVKDIKKESIDLILNCPKVVFAKWIIALREVIKTFHQI